MKHLNNSSSALLCVSVSPPCHIWSHLHSFLTDIWTRFTTGHHSGLSIGREIWRLPIMSPWSNHHMMSHVMIILWITAPSLTILLDAHHRGMKWSLFCWGNDYEWNSDPVLLNNTGLSALICRKSLKKMFCVHPTIEALSEYGFLYTYFAFLCHHVTMFLFVQECRPGALLVFLWQRAQKLHRN